jgi:hypothetical protein
VIPAASDIQLSCRTHLEYFGNRDHFYERAGVGSHAKGSRCSQRLFMNGDPPVWNEGTCVGEPPMPGPAVTVDPGYGLTCRSITSDRVRVGDFLPQILAYHRRRNTRMLEMTRLYVYPRWETGRQGGPLHGRWGGGPTHVPFQMVWMRLVLVEWSCLHRSPLQRPRRDHSLRQKCLGHHLHHHRIPLVG